MNTTNSTVLYSTARSPVFVIICVALYVLIIGTSLLGNALVCLAICINKRLRSSPTMTFIFSLACSDLLVASLAMPFDAEGLLQKGKWQHGEVLCIVWTTAYLFSVPASILTLLVLTVDRYKSLSDPLRRFRKSKFLSVRCARVTVVSLWCYCLAISLLPAMGWRYNPSYVIDGYCIFNITPTYSAISTVLHFILPLLFIGAVYFKIYRIAQDVKHCQALREAANAFPEHLTRHPSARDHRNYQSNLKATKTIALIVCALFICWLPYSTVSFAFVLCKSCHFAVPPEVMIALLLLGYLNSALNPFIYALRNRKFKETYRPLLLSIRRFSRMSSNRSAESSTARSSIAISSRRRVSVTSQTSSVQLTAFSISLECRGVEEMTNALR